MSNDIFPKYWFTIAWSLFVRASPILTAKASYDNLSITPSLNVYVSTFPVTLPPLPSFIGFPFSSVLIWPFLVSYPLGHLTVIGLSDNFVSVLDKMPASYNAFAISKSQPDASAAFCSAWIANDHPASFPASGLRPELLFECAKANNAASAICASL